MREGAALVTNGGVRKRNLNYIIKRLEACSDKYGGCDGCPDLDACIKAFDERCFMGENVSKKEK